MASLPYTLIFLFAGAIIVLLAGILEERSRNVKAKEVLSIVFIALALGGTVLLYRDVTSGPQSIALFLIGGEKPPLAACFEIDLLSVFMIFSSVSLGLFVAIYSFRYMERDSRLGEYYSLLLLLIAGTVGVALAGDFFTFFVFWELMCISSYILVAFRKDRAGAIEGGFKYFIMSSLGSVLILLGMSLLYGMAGNLNFAYLSQMIDWQTGKLWGYLAFILIFIGFGVKAAIVPMHTWIPDAYVEAPSPVAAMSSGILIEMGLYGLARVFFVVFQPSMTLIGGPDSFKYIFAIFSLVTMTLGNVLALYQKDINRIFAYSSIAQMGYMLIGIASGTAYGLLGSFLHVFNHSLMKGGAFLSSGAMIQRAETRNVDEMKGLGRAMPTTTIALTISVLGLGGVPMTAGFISKFILFSSALAPNVNLWWLAVAGVLNSALSIAYYLRIVQRLITKPARDFSAIREAPASMLVPVVVMTILIVVFGVYPLPIAQFADGAAKALTTGLQDYIRAIVL